MVLCRSARLLLPQGEGFARRAAKWVAMVRLSQVLQTGLRQQQELRLHLGMRISQTLRAGRTDFWEEVRRLEESPLFLTLAQPGARGRRSVRIVPRRTAYFLEHYNRPAKDPGDVEALLEGLGPLVERVRALGVERFAALFLSEVPVSLEEQAEITGLTLEELRIFRERVIDKVFVAGIFEQGSGPASVEARAYERIGRFAVVAGTVRFEPFLERRRYEIDEALVAERIRSGLITGAEAQEVKQLLRTLGFVNLRLDLFHQVAELITLRQAPYMRSGREDDLALLEEAEAAEILGVHPSWLCRLLQGRGALTPWGEKALRFFFVAGKTIRRRRGKEALAELLRSSAGPRSDADLSRLLLERTGIRAARRTINVWRREIGG